MASTTRRSPWTITGSWTPIRSPCVTAGRTPPKRFGDGAKKQRWHSFEVAARSTAQAIQPGSEEEFITEHNRGYTSAGRRTTRTAEYAVEHPTWQVYPIVKTAIDVDFGASYGERFQFLNGAEPRSMLLAEGSAIVVRQGVRLG